MAEQIDWQQQNVQNYVTPTQYRFQNCEYQERNHEQADHDSPPPGQEVSVDELTDYASNDRKRPEKDDGHRFASKVRKQNYPQSKCSCYREQSAETEL